VSSSDKKNHIIFVDDDRTNTILIKTILEMDGFVVTICPDVSRACDAAQNGVDAFVIDCNLAHGDDGVSLLKAIRSGRTAAELTIPVIVTSGDDRRCNDANKEGATQFLVKPYSPSILSEELNRLLL
jgi:two-component system phosphate regulon response regulator OmpR